MDPINDAPVETAPQDQTLAQPESQAGVITNTAAPTAAQVADAEREFDEFYSDTPPPAPAEEIGAPAEEAAPAGEQPPAADPVVDPPQPPPPVDGDVEIPGQLRPRLHDQKDIALLIFAKANGITVMEAARRMMASEPQQPAAVPPGDNGQPPAPAPQASAVQELESQIATLTAEMQAERENENTFTVEYQDKLMQLADLRGDLKLAKFQEGWRAQAQQQSQAQEAGRAVDASFEAARSEFPTIGDPASPLRQVADAVAADWQSNPATVGRLSRTDFPQMLAREAAERVAADLVTTGKFRTIDLALASLKAAPAAPATPAAPAAVIAPRAGTPPAAPATRRVAPAPGSRTQQNPGQHQTPAAAIAATNDPAELDRMFDEAAESGALGAGLRRR